jgi:hypothetical protein
VIELLGTLYNQAERMFQDNKNTATNQQTKQDLNQTRFTFVFTFITLGIQVGDKLIL